MGSFARPRPQSAAAGKQAASQSDNRKPRPVSSSKMTEPGRNRVVSNTGVDRKKMFSYEGNSYVMVPQSVNVYPYDNNIINKNHPP